MTLLADLPEIVGFFSYSRQDDQHSEGALTRLRARIFDELRLQLGRDVKLWQDTAAIPQGAQWEEEIKRAIAESIFFIPILTPAALASKYCRFELESFLEREALLGRTNLVFPLLYVTVPALEHEEGWRHDEMLQTIGVRQYLDWRNLRHRDLKEPEVARKIELLCRNIVDALRRPSILPNGHQQKEEFKFSTVSGERLVSRGDTSRHESRRSSTGLYQPSGQDASFQFSSARRPAAFTSWTASSQGISGSIPTKKSKGLTLLVAAIAAMLVLAAIGGWLWKLHWEIAQPTTAITAAANTSTYAPLSAERERALNAKADFKECTNCPEMIVLPSGNFTMGSSSSEVAQGRAYANETPQHNVVISNRFAIGKYEVTFAEWDACVSDGGCAGYWPSDAGWGRGKRPAINVSWNDAELYVQWLSQKTGQTYRLPSEAEWEFAARAGSSTRFYFGDDAERLCKYANVADATGSQDSQGTDGFATWESCVDGYFHTAPVGSFLPNAFGLYDVLGNVAEWVEDVWHENYIGAPTDGSSWVAGGDPKSRVARGGSWYNLEDGTRSAVRFFYLASSRGELVGFRVARTLLPQ